MIYLIRHGETEANIKHIYCGSTDLPLSATGAEKLQLCRETPVISGLRGRAVKCDEAGCSPQASPDFVTSGMKRTEQTMKLLFGGVSHRQDSRFREIDFGIFEMKSYYELKDTMEYQEWISGDNEANVCPEGESGRQMEARVMEAFEELLGRYLGSGSPDVVVVTHGGVIAAIMNNLFPDEGRSRFDWQPDPGHGYVISGREYGEI